MGRYSLIQYMLLKGIIMKYDNMNIYRGWGRSKRVRVGGRECKGGVSGVGLSVI